ncbi:MAG: cytidylate kinase-like family protein [Pirellulaceae bacterium]
MSGHVAAIEHKAEFKIKKWILSEKTDQGLERMNMAKSVHHFVALSRETGALGSEVAERIADRLNWDLLDSRIVDYMEEQYGTPRCLLQSVDERHENWTSSIFTSRIGGLGFSETTHSHRVAKLLLLAASKANVVIVGRGGQFILPRSKGLSVRIVAPMDFRIQQVMLERRIGERDARRHIIATDHDRHEYIRCHFGKNVSDPHHYDLVLNVGDITIDGAADMIVESVDRLVRRLD